MKTPMTRPFAQPPRSLYDFSPQAERYENWYLTPEGQECDSLQQHDVFVLMGFGPYQGRLLDVGCGTGHWSRFFHSLGFKVQGVDISEKMIRVARGLNSDCEFEVANGCELPFQDASFNVAATMATLEFVAAPAVVLREMARCVKPGGRLMVGTLSRIATLNKRRLSRSEQPYASGRLLSPLELWDLLSPLGSPRMLASRRPNETKSRIESIVDNRSDLKRLPNGPFLVAEVRQ
jgi:SAM-dependent methyltransferase